MSDYGQISENLPKDLLIPKEPGRKKKEDGGFFFKPESVRVKMFLSDEDLLSLEPALPEDPTTVDCSDNGRNTIPQQILDHIIEQTDYFEKMLIALKDKPTEATHNAKKEFIGTAPSLIKNLALRVKYLQSMK